MENQENYAGTTLPSVADGSFVPSPLAITENRTIRTKELRKALDVQLQIAKTYRHAANMYGTVDEAEQAKECCLAIELSIMRLGMCLKAIGNANPYPNSYDTTNTIIDKTADGLKL